MYLHVVFLLFGGLFGATHTHSPEDSLAELAKLHPRRPGRLASPPKVPYKELKGSWLNPQTTKTHLLLEGGLNVASTWFTEQMARV